MDMADLLLLSTPEFGHGAHSLVRVEETLVVFLLGLLSGVMLMAAFFVWFMRREQRRSRFPDETVELLEELEDAGDSRASSPPRPGSNGPAPEVNPREAWEKDADWWRQ